MISQLRNHIPLAGPATRELCDGSEERLRVSLGFTPRWYHDRLGIDFSEKWHTDPDYRYETLVEMKEYLHGSFPAIPYFQPQYVDKVETTCATISGVFGILIISMIYGCEPVYAKDAWPDAHPIFSLDEISDLPPVVDIERNEIFRQLSSQMDQIERRWGPIHGYLNYQGILNIAVKLRSSDLFLDMVDEPETVNTFFSNIANTIRTTSKYVQNRQCKSGFKINLLSMSNCTMSMISPWQYENFLLPLDRSLSIEYEHFGIHTCNWVADPYLDSLRSIEKMDYLDTGINSDLKRIKKMFPDTRRAILLTPGEIASKSSSELADDIKYINQDYAPCDIVLADVETTMPNSRVELLLDLVEQEMRRIV